jgi:hypothetical protein
MIGLLVFAARRSKVVHRAVKREAGGSIPVFCIGREAPPNEVLIAEESRGQICGAIMKYHCTDVTRVNAKRVPAGEFRNGDHHLPCRRPQFRGGIALASVGPTTQRVGGHVWGTKAKPLA